MKSLVCRSIVTLVVTGILFLAIITAASALEWNWEYSAPEIEASGTLTTNDTADARGFFTVTDIMGSRNGVAITGLHPPQTSMPGNEPFVLDNLIRLAPEQFTQNGIGFSTADGNFASVYFADFLDRPGFFEVFSAAPFIPGFDNFGPEDSETPVSFSATLVP